jgi:hypothetical protein
VTEFRCNSRASLATLKIHRRWQRRILQKRKNVAPYKEPGIAGAEIAIDGASSV